MQRLVSILMLYSALVLHGYSQEFPSQPKEIPATRPQLKQMLEKVKHQQARLPLPPPTDQERRPPERTSPDLSGETFNTARLKKLYLHKDLLGNRANEGRSQGQKKDPLMSLNPTFTVELVWIASRANNCQYCLGHQEVKLRALGEQESRLAAIDCDWSRFTPAERAAFGLARKLTLRPDALTDEDLQSALEHFKPLQVLEMVMVISRYNMANRWNSSLAIPQEEYRFLLSETPNEFKDTESIVAPLQIEPRAALESREATRAFLENARNRMPRLPLVEVANAREILNDSAEHPKVWMRLLANFPVEGKRLIELYQFSLTKGLLSPELKAQIAWATAREDRAWYALNLAMSRLKSLNYSDERVFDLDKADHSSGTDVGHVLAFTRKLTRSPQAIVDEDVLTLRKHFSDPEVAEIVHHITLAAFFNRVTEAAALHADPEY